MEDLYSNLDNYEEVNVIDELRNENKNLKLKVDEYAIAMEKLQKDFDILSSEFKRLEINYSSLLKTARAEVERKTQIITNLNMEKDMLVLNSLQNGNQSLLSIRRNMTKNKITPNKTRNNKNNDSDSSKSNKNSSRELKESSAKLKDFSSERLEENIRPSADTAQNSKTDNSKLLNKPIENVESCSDRNSDAKEINTHHKDGYEGSVSAQSGSIKHRRKSMLALSAQDEKFSTDEEWDTDFITKEPKEYSSRKEYSSSKKNERDINEKPNRKYSDPSNIDDKYYSSHESSRETRKSRNYRNYDGDKYRSQEKYEYSRKSWRHISPDRSHRRPSGDYHDGQNQRSGYRNRVLESPPPDKYSNYKRKTREHRMNSERNHPHIVNGNKRHYQSEKQTNKYKMSNDYDEPSNKRLRTNSFHRHIEEDDNKHPRTSSYHRHVEEEDGCYDDINNIDNGAFSENYPDLRSCQSPDFLYSDLQQSNHQIKEIKHTATTQLEDPRMTSKKYVVKSDDEKVTLCTAVGRNVHIEPINKSKWNIQRVDIPKLLVQKPIEVQRTEINETLVKEIYMDIDIENPVSNLSLESGEIYFGSENVPNSMTKELNHKDVENSGRCEKVGTNTQELFQKAEDPTKVLSTGYKIPKHRHCVKEANSYNPGVIDNYLSGKPKSVEMIKDNNEKINTKDYRKKPEILDCHDNLTKNIKNTVHYVNQQDLQNKYIISSRQIVEGDLELSDEASDNNELHHFVRKDINTYILHDPKQCKNDNTVKVNAENVESLQDTSQPNKNKEIFLVDKDHKTIPNKQYKSSIFDIQHVDEIKEKADNKKSKEILKIGESQMSINKKEKQLSMIEIEPPELEIKEKVNNKNKEKKLVDKNYKTNKKNIPEEEANTKDKEENISDKILRTQSKPHSSIIDVQHYVDDNDISLEIKNTVNNQATCQMNVSEWIGIKNKVEEIKEKANTDKNNENRKSNENNKNTTAKWDIELSAEEIKDKNEKNNDIYKLSNKNNKCNQKQDQPMMEVKKIEEDTNVNSKHPTSLTLQKEKEIKDECDKEMLNRIESNEPRQSNPFKKDKKNVKKIDKSDKNTEINEAKMNQKTDKNIDIIVNDKSSEHIKSKSKKKSHKLKETQKKESLGDTESPQVTVKKKSKIEKDIKHKFTDLFGDSCSLITPEELGINSGPVETILKSSNINLPIFDDAQDAIDLKEITKVQQSPIDDDALNEENPSCMTDLESNTKQNATASKVDVESQDNEVQYVSGEIVKVNENVNIEPPLKENDVVKTIIISTGIQPSSLENINKLEIRHNTVNIAANTQTNSNAMLKSREFSLKALATSTPHKDVHDKVLEPEPRVQCIDNSIQTSEQSDTNTLDSQTDVDTDVPDVRIFVRRRRKVIKKPTT